jgi:hypothetical protein
MDRVRQTECILKLRLPLFIELGYRVEELHVTETRGPLGKWRHELVVRPSVYVTPRELWWRLQWRKIFPYRPKEMA